MGSVALPIPRFSTNVMQQQDRVQGEHSAVSSHFSLTGGMHHLDSFHGEQSATANSPKTPEKDADETKREAGIWKKLAEMAKKLADWVAPNAKKTDASSTASENATAAMVADAKATAVIVNSEANAADSVATVAKV